VLPVLRVPAAERQALLEGIDRVGAEIGARQRRLLSMIHALDSSSQEDWEDEGASSLPHLLSHRLGISYWKAERWVACARALEDLPLLARALEQGRLSLDKVVELSRFAGVEDEADLIRWADGASAGRIRRVGELRRRTQANEAERDAAQRSVWWWWSQDGRRFGLEADLPAAEGLVVSRAIARLAAKIPAMPGEGGRGFAAERRADALVSLSSAALAAETDLDRATIVVHATPEALASDDRSVSAEGGAVLHAATARRLACTARIQAVLEDPSGTPLRLGRTRREPSAWMLRQLRHRDGECTFPGCGHRTFTQGHHVAWWEHGGRTDLDNLVLVCTFHHRLVHEHRWSLARDPGTGVVTWCRPDGTPFHAGPAPPVESVA
jgi:hypothetical protein